MMRVESFAHTDTRFADFRAFADELYADDAHWTHPDNPPEQLSPHCFIVVDDSRIVARACVTRRPAGAADVETTMGCGWYECIDDHNTAAMLLEAVRAYARHEGYSTLIGPINGSTWHRYRFADPSTSPPFFLDVHNKPWYVSQWRDNGMHEIAHFASTIFDGLASYGDADPRLQKQRDGGIVLRQIRVDDIENELRAIHSISLEGFKDNYLYSPISVDDFMALYRPV
ncbi:MAG: hypothetical protein H7X80_02535, partial [bacterium]|nr:hypothetical protein [Candidatus Kapabacteria bacterium]